MGILKGTFKRGIESEITFTKVSGDVSQYIWRSKSLWHPLSSSIPKNKQNVSLEIFKTSVCFLFMTVQLGVANKEWFKKSERVPILSNLLIFTCSTTYHDFHISYLNETALDSLDKLWSSSSFPGVDGSFSTAAHLLILSWAFSYSLTELQNYSLWESLIKSFEAPKSQKNMIFLIQV